MEITAVELIGLAVFWSFFYFFLSHYIAGLSRDAWVEYIRSEESDEMLLEALDPIVNEIAVSYTHLTLPTILRV